MSSDRIAQLHEQASEFYLNGDYAGALQAWRDVLALDPGNEQAMDGVRMASQFAEPPPAAPAAQPELDHELDRGLSVFDSLGAAPSKDPNATMMIDRSDVAAALDRKPAPAQRPAAAPAPAAAAASMVTGINRQSDGIDFGDISGVGAIPLGATDVPEQAQAQDASAAHDTTEAPEATEAHAEEPSYGLEEVGPPNAFGGNPSAAAVELHRRVADLLSEAKSKADAGERDEALAILARLSILDEDNTEAHELRARIEAGGPTDLARTEQAIIEGVSALESDRLDDAEKYFNEALQLSPGHREAQHYLEKVHERRSGTSAASPLHGGEDLLGGEPHAGDLLGTPPPVEIPSTAAVPLAAPVAPGKSSRARSVEPPVAPVVPTAGRAKLPSLKLVFAGGLGAIALICAAMFLPSMLKSGKKLPPPPPPRAAKPVAKPIAAAKPSVPEMSPAERSAAIATAMAKGKTQMAAGDAAGAVISFNAALGLDPANAEAKAGLTEAGEIYKAHKAEQDAMDSIKVAFRDGEYTSGLRVAYRLPPSVPKSYIDGVKVAGWYNLAVVSLRAGDCKEALSNLGEALGVAPGDAEAVKLKDFATRYQNAPKDRSFLDQVEALAFKPLPSS